MNGDMTRADTIAELEYAEKLLHEAADALRNTYPGDKRKEFLHKLGWFLISIDEVLQFADDIDEENKQKLYLIIQQGDR